MKELSIFVDESGDFGAYNSKYAPQYILTMVFHDQEISINEDIKAANNSLTSSELMIFHLARDLKKDFLKLLKAKEL